MTSVCEILSEDVSRASSISVLVSDARPPVVWNTWMLYIVGVGYKLLITWIGVGYRYQHQQAEIRYSEMTGLIFILRIRLTIAKQKLAYNQSQHTRKWHNFLGIIFIYSLVIWTVVLCRVHLIKTVFVYMLCTTLLHKVKFFLLCCIIDRIK